MSTLVQGRARSPWSVIGVTLVTIGLVGFAITSAGIDPTRWLGGSGWTLFLIVPGLALLATGLLTREPLGLGLTIAGSVLTTLGSMMLVMDRTGTWETWAFAWALIPMAAGLGLVLHGLRAGRPERTTIGIRLMAGFGAVLIVGAWFFGTLFRTGTAPIELGNAWPLVLVAGGVVAIVVAMLRKPSGEDAAGA